MASDAVMEARSVLVHPLVVRITHWINAFAVLAMVASGWRIYDAAPIWDFEIPKALTLGGWLGGALQWHFAAMWVLVINGLVYVGYGLAARHFAKRLLPVSPAAALRDVGHALRGRLAHDDLSVYNHAQKTAYIVIILALVVLVLSGLSIWKPVQLQELAAIFGGYEGARIVHFVAMAVMVLVVLVHIAVALLVPRTLPTMFTGRLRRKP